MSKILRAIKRYYYLLHSVFFNFYYLPFKQAIKLPIILYNPVFFSLKGKMKIDSNNISPGMIRLGLGGVSIFPDIMGIHYENHGGVIVFKGKCEIGSSSSISIGKDAIIVFGENFKATYGCKIVSYSQIIFGDNVLVGWDCLFVDSDFHVMYDASTDTMTQSRYPIHIGNNNWFAMKCTILKGTSTPDFCTVGASSLLNKKYILEPRCFLAGNPAKLISSDLYWDKSKDKIDY